MSFFKKITDLLTSNETRFNDAWITFLINQLNKMGDISITKFPNGVTGKAFKIPSEFPLSKLSIYPKINLLELAQQFVHFGLLYEVDGARDLMKENVYRLHTEVKSVIPSFIISADEMFEIFEHSALIFIDLLNKEQVIPNKTLLFDRAVAYNTEGEYDNIFRNFYQIVGFYSFIVLPIFNKFDEEIESFLIEQQSNSFKSFTDFTNGDLLRDIYEKNVNIGLIQREKINVLHNTVLNVGADNDNFRLESYIEWLKLVIIYNGNSLEVANERIKALYNRLNEISENWAEVGRIGLIIAELENIPFIRRYNLFLKISYLISNLYYKKV